MRGGTLLREIPQGVNAIRILLAQFKKTEKSLDSSNQDIQLEFVKDANGQVTEVTLRLNGREFHAKKIN